MELIAPILIILFFGNIVYRVINDKKKKKRKVKSGSTFASIDNFRPYFYYITEYSGFSIAFDKDKKKVCFLDQLNRVYLYEFDKVLQSEIIENNIIVNSKSIASTVGRSVLGGILAGGVGAIIGGQSASATQNNLVNLISLRIIINDPLNSIFTM